MATKKTNTKPENAFLSGLNEELAKSNQFTPLKTFANGEIIPIAGIELNTTKFGEQYSIVDGETQENVSLPSFYTKKFDKMDEQTRDTLTNGEYAAKVYRDDKGYARFEIVPLFDYQ